MWLNFDGINWKAEVYLNGKKLGDIEGAFIRGKFDITDIVNYSDEKFVMLVIITSYYYYDHSDPYPYPLSLSLSLILIAV